MTTYTGMTWFCCSTQPRAEKRAEIALTELGFEVFSPMEIHWSRKGVVKTVTRRRKAQSVPTQKIEKPLFPGYAFFACSDPDGWSPARRADGVQAVVGKLSETGKDDLHEIRVNMAAGAYDYTKGAEPVVFDPQEPIRVVAGHFSGWTGLVARMDGPDRVRLMLTNMLGKQTAVTVDVEAVEKAA